MCVIEIPSIVKAAYLLNKLNKNTLWRDAIKKEMLNVSIDIHILQVITHPPLLDMFLSVKFIFDVKMDFKKNHD